ncbi:MAG: response regulator transcription factor [Flavobacteriales bacterium]|nr:response regulator transcription factor [Flavobacteriales bacterium]
MNNYRILLVEDEKNLADTIRLNLVMENYTVVHAADGPEALEKFRCQAFDLCIMDIMIPVIDGLAVCETIRLEGNTTPVLFLSAKSSGKERVEGLKIGGDDYLTKPFNLEELLLRIGKLIQRRGEEGKKSLADLDTYSFGPNQIHFLTYTIRGKNGKEQVITKKEIMLLKLLVQRQGEVVSREEILEKIWGYDVFPSTRTIDNYVLAFRKYFEPDTRQPRYFHSVRSVGYRFVSGD